MVAYATQCVYTCDAVNGACLTSANRCLRLSCYPKPPEAWGRAHLWRPQPPGAGPHPPSCHACYMHTNHVVHAVCNTTCVALLLLTSDAHDAPGCTGSPRPCIAVLCHRYGVLLFALWQCDIICLAIAEGADVYQASLCRWPCASIPCMLPFYIMHAAILHPRACCHQCPIVASTLPQTKLMSGRSGSHPSHSSPTSHIWARRGANSKIAMCPSRQPPGLV